MPQKILNALYHFLWPHTCVLCHRKTQRLLDLCWTCQHALPCLQHHCQYCAESLSEHALVCGRCLQHPPPFDKTYATFCYQPPVTQMLMALKFHHQLNYAQLLGTLLAQHLQHQYTQSLPQCILPVPLHPKRLKERGFNQAIEIAKPIAKQLQLPIVRNICERTHHTNAQARLPAKQRRHNIKHVFAIKKTHQTLPNHVAIVDDIMTTGHTVRALSTVLKKSGVQHIDIWCCARASVLSR